MGKLLFICLFLSFSGILRGQGIEFFRGSFDEALAEANKQEKLLFVDMYAEWCEPCKLLATQVFPLEKVGDYFNSRFVCYQLNVELPENKSVVQKYRVQGLPTLLFCDRSGEVISRQMGVVTPELLLRLGRVATKEQKTPDELYNMYKKNKKDYSIHQMILLDAPYFMPELQGSQQERWMQRLKNLYDEYIVGKGLENMINREDFNIFSMYHERMQESDEVIDFIVKNLNQYVAVVDSNIIAQYVTMLHYSCVIELAREGKQSYQQVLQRMMGDMKQVYSILSPEIDKSYKINLVIADANYALYHEKNVGKYIQLMDSFLEQQGNPQVNDYVLAVETLFNGQKGKLTNEGYNKALLWLDAALKGEVSKDMQVMMVMTMGDCFLALKNREKAKECYNQSYLLSLQLPNQQAIMQIQGTLKQKLNQLE